MHHLQVDLCWRGLLESNLPLAEPNQQTESKSKMAAIAAILNNKTH
jgi:hypothetical protein